VNRPIASVAYLLFNICFAIAQQPAGPTQFSSPAEPHLTEPQIDNAKILTGIRATFYHPDNLTGMECGAVFDWASVAKQLNQTLPEDRAKALSGMNVEVHANKGQPVITTVTWSNGKPANGDTLELSTKQIMTGFFQMYWSFSGLADPQAAKEIHIEPRSEGGYFLSGTANGTTSEVQVDKDLVPTTIHVNSPAMKAQLGLQFTPPPNPLPGDLRRLTDIDGNFSIGTTIMHFRYGIDYQTIGGFHIPQHVSINVGGAYTLSIELIGCSVSQEMTVAAPPK
jgi:hypothetical protein